VEAFEKEEILRDLVGLLDKNEKLHSEIAEANIKLHSFIVHHNKEK